MSADFWAGYISGAVGIIIGNPLDVLKVKLQAGVVSSSPSVPRPILPTTTNGTTSSLPSHTIPTASSSTRSTSYLRPFLTGTAAPVLGYGALNALLFVSYNRTEAFLNQALLLQVHPTTSTSLSATTGSNLYTTWLAGAVGGLATWVVSTPTELIKCRVQLASSSSSSSAPSQSSPPTSVSSWSTIKHILHSQGIKGLYFGGLVTALRDSIGYGFYFWSYELTSRWMASTTTPGSEGAADPARVLLCGGLAGIVTWASIFPLDVIKTRVQTQALHSHSPSPLPAAAAAASSSSANRLESEPLLLKHPAAAAVQEGKRRPLGAWEVAKQTYAQGGIRPFFRGLGVCSVRAFIVNAVQWAVYEWIMAELGVGRNRNGNQGVSAGSTALSSASTAGGEIVL
ncbi:mitochondrial carrier domain-containing protein [Rhypophila decipiens]|uniref:Mitochondrial carrier domain-containing protein n=1 Tax=Rhypophila decipiens TaxID=261697 RepID=A0AAN7BAQ6_9PEZI|nr:mitochondrial carrier domain-containing protein [Rhypophila decipiens]